RFSRDWSSDVCSSDLGQLLAAPAVAQGDGDGALGVGLADDVAVELGDDLAGRQGRCIGHWLVFPDALEKHVLLPAMAGRAGGFEIGRAACRERVGMGV